LNELTAQATGKSVILGPVEATAVGNALVQLAALRGVPDSLDELRAVVRRSFRLETVEPKGGAG
ncbi:MAG: rhamnulokinase, partial [Armatimonadetes bacterium]